MMFLTLRAFTDHFSMNKQRVCKTLAVGLLSIASFGGSVAQTSKPVQELNIYSARHYQTDELLYGGFTKATGIKINRIEASDNALIERLKSEGVKSPADVILLVDAARLWRAEKRSEERL